MLSLSANTVAKVWWKSNVLTTAVINLLKMLLVMVNTSALKDYHADGTLKLKRDHSY